MTGIDAEPIRVSWSQIRAHEECKQKAALFRAHKRGPAGNLRGFYHGMVVDSAMREYLDNPQRGPGDMAARIDMLIDEGIDDAKASGDGVVRWKHAHDRIQMAEFCTELVGRLEPLLDRHVLPYEFVSGKRFTAPLNAAGTRINLVGEMDLLVREPTGYVVWDLKGTADPTYYRKVLGQLIFYDLATWCETGQKTRLTGLLQPMCPEPVIEHHVTDQDRRVMLARILRYVSDVKHHRQDCKDGTAGCSWCEVNHACIRFRPDTTPSGTTMSLSAALRTAARESS